MCSWSAALSSLQYGVYGVRISGFEHEGVLAAPPATPCTNPSFPNHCLPIVKADEDKVHIEYGPLPNQPVPEGATINIVACYSNVSSFNRPWRANSTKTDIGVRRLSGVAASYANASVAS